VLLDALPIFSDASRHMLWHVVGSKLFLAERTDTEVTVVFAANVAYQRFSPREDHMAGRTRMCLARLSASFEVIEVFGVHVSLQ
jgi:hypothetical protein